MRRAVVTLAGVVLALAGPAGCGDGVRDERPGSVLADPGTPLGEGMMVPQETQLVGPAFSRPSRDGDHRSSLSVLAVEGDPFVIWDGMFPDRRDARILTVLPLRGRVLIAARLLALAALAGIFLVGVNAAPTLFYGPQVARYGAATNVIRGAMAHLVATTLAGAFVFCLLVALQGVVLNLGGRRASERLSVLLQVFFVVALLQMIFFLPRMRSLLPGDLSTVWSDPWLRWIPSIWFLGLYDVLGGRPATGAMGLARYAVLASGASIAGAAGLVVLTHRREPVGGWREPLAEGHR